MREALYDNLSRSAGNKKWISATAVADYGDAQAFWVPPSTPFQTAICVGSATLMNRSASTAHVGLGARLPVGVWTAGQVTAAGVITDDTTDAQNATTADFPMHDRTDSGSGFYVSADLPFNILGIVQSAAGDQTTPVKIVEYWNGSAWTDIVASLLISDTLIGSGTGEKILCWPLPSDWAVGGTGTGMPSGKYNLRVRHTTAGAGTANPVASQVFVGIAKMLFDSLANLTGVTLIRDHDYIFPPQCSALFPVFSVASQNNIVEADVRAI